MTDQLKKWQDVCAAIDEFTLGVLMPALLVSVEVSGTCESARVTLRKWAALMGKIHGSDVRRHLDPSPDLLSDVIGEVKHLMKDDFHRLCDDLRGEIEGENLWTRICGIECDLLNLNR